jgi:UDP-glucuronate 4-epimerase
LILVTGGAGFIGYHLLKNIGDQSQVLSLDSFSNYYSVELKKLRCRNIERDLGVSVVELDMVDSIELDKLFKENKIETVIHLAAQPGVRISPSKYSNYVNSNLLAFENLLQACVVNDVQNLIFASSSSVYGNHAKIPFSEEESFLRPRSYYGATKLSNEITARVVSERHGLRILGLRFFTVYGPWGRPDMAYTRVASALLNDEDFNLFGDGSVIRDFTYVSDVVKSVLKLTETLPTLKEGSFEILNIGGGKPVSLIEMIGEFENQLGKKLRILNRESNPSDVIKTHADWTKLHTICGDFPKTSLTEGIEETIAWAKDPEIKPKLKSWIQSVV